MRPSALFFDVDGVLIDSMHVKGEAFAALFDARYRSSIVALHHRHGGTNRRAKIRMIFEQVLALEPQRGEIDELVQSYSELILGKILTCPEVPGAREALSVLSRIFPLHAVSATPQVELEEILHHRDLLHFFQSVHGHPSTKISVIGKLIEHHNYVSESCFLIGDSLSDLAAARTWDVPFIFVHHSGGEAPEGSLRSVPNLVGLVNVIEELSRPLKRQPDGRL